MRALILLLIFLSTGLSAQTSYHLSRSDGKTTRIHDYTASSKKSCPDLLVLSHGLGGSRQTLAKLARSASELGFRVITLDHRESGRRALRKIVFERDRPTAFAQILASPSINQARARDLDAALAHVYRACRPRLSVLAGHSMGAQTTMIEAGAKNHLGVSGQDRFNAYIALSPQGSGTRFPKHAWRHIEKPMLVTIGTRDDALEGDYRWRLEAYAGLPRGGKHLAVINHATHIDISGRPNNSRANLSTRIFVDYLKALQQGQPISLPHRKGAKYQQK